MKPATPGNAPQDCTPPTARSTTSGTVTAVTPPARRSRLWLWFVLAFVLQLGAWIAWFMIADQHRVETVPLVRVSTPN